MADKHSVPILIVCEFAIEATPKIPIDNKYIINFHVSPEEVFLNYGKPYKLNKNKINCSSLICLALIITKNKPNITIWKENSKEKYYYNL